MNDKALLKQLCPCNSGLKYRQCCRPYLSGKQAAPTPEVLMRSRYTAYVIANIDYILATMKGKALVDFDRDTAKAWAEQSKWIKLEVLAAPPVKANSTEGFVEFIAYYIANGIPRTLHEKSRFLREANRWYYVDGH